MFLTIDGACKRYGHHVVLDRISLSLAKGECLALLGPSGCGKTTLLNAVAGFLALDGGRISIDGQDMADVPTYRRDIGMVFQDHALFPHLSVLENVAFGLRMRRVAKGQRREMAQASLDLVGLAGYQERAIHQLSGGQRQRVAIARALATKPRMLLFDEPLASLDTRLREAMRTEIRAIIDRVGITALFVTHDQAEAFAVADRVAILNAGKIEQVGQPDEIYEKPASRFAATFLGGCNLIEGTVTRREGNALIVRAADLELRAQASPALASVARGQAVTLAIRPHHMEMSRVGGATADNAITGTVASLEYLGAMTRLVVTAGEGQTLSVECPGRQSVRPGEAVGLSWKAADTWTIADRAGSP